MHYCTIASLICEQFNSILSAFSWPKRISVNENIGNRQCLSLVEKNERILVNCKDILSRKGLKNSFPVEKSKIYQIIYQLIEIGQFQTVSLLLHCCVDRL